METEVAKLAKAKSVDGSFTKLAVKKFPEDALLEERIEAMRDFMHAIFQNFVRHSVSDILVIG